MDESMEQSTKRAWSYSRTTCFGHCKYEFYLDYVINDDEQYLSEGNYYAEVGSFVHEILAKIFQGEIKSEDAAEYFIENYENNIFYKVKESTMTKTYDACLEYFLTTDFDWIDNYDILGVELEQHFVIDGYEFVGYIDLLLRDKSDGKIVVLDHKSAPYPMKKDGEIKKNQLQSFTSYKKQMYLYCNSIYQQYHEFPKEIVWNHFKDGGKFAKIPFKQDEYDETIKWFIDTIKTIEKEEDFEPSQDFFYCTNLCNFRHSCEYKNHS